MMLFFDCWLLACVRSFWISSRFSIPESWFRGWCEKIIVGNSVSARSSFEPCLLRFAHETFVARFFATRFVSIQHHEVDASLVERVVTGRHAIELNGLFRPKSSIHVVVAKNVLARHIQVVEKIKEFLILGLWNTEVTQLDGEVHVLFLDGRRKLLHPLFAVVHDVLMNVSDDGDSDSILGVSSVHGGCH